MLLLILCFVSLSVQGQLDETWTATAGGQSAQVLPDGSFSIWNVPDYGVRNRSGETRRGLMMYQARSVRKFERTESIDIVGIAGGAEVVGSKAKLVVLGR